MVSLQWHAGEEHRSRERANVSGADKYIYPKAEKSNPLKTNYRWWQKGWWK